MTAAIAFNPRSSAKTKPKLSKKKIQSNIHRIRKKRAGLDDEFNRRVAKRQSAKFDDNRAMNMFGGILIDILTGGAGMAFMDVGLDIIGDMMAGHGLSITKDGIRAAMDGIIDTVDSETKHLRADNDNDPVRLAFIENEEMAMKKAEEDDLDWFLIFLLWMLWTDNWDHKATTHNYFDNRGVTNRRRAKGLRI